HHLRNSSSVGSAEMNEAPANPATGKPQVVITGPEEEDQERSSGNPWLSTAGIVVIITLTVCIIFLTTLAGDYVSYLQTKSLQALLVVVVIRRRSTALSKFFVRTPSTESLNPFSA